MRVDKIIFFLFALTLCFSCEEKVITHTATRKIINETSHHIRILIYDDEKFEFEIDSQDSVEINGHCSYGFINYCDVGWHTDYNEWNAKIFLTNNEFKILILKPTPSTYTPKKFNLTQKAGMDILNLSLKFTPTEYLHKTTTIQNQSKTKSSIRQFHFLDHHTNLS